MYVTDPVADLLTRIRNGGMAGHPIVKAPSSKLKAEVARVLKEEGYLEDVRHVEGTGAGELQMTLRYRNGRSVITSIRRESRPGQRVYVNADAIPKVMNGFGIAILTTSRGVMSGRRAKELGVGGEYLCSVY